MTDIVRDGTKVSDRKILQYQYVRYISPDRFSSETISRCRMVLCDTVIELHNII